MSLIQAIILGIVQGLTEFLPISSSGHLVLVQALLGFSEPLVEFDVILHIGTLFAVFFFFYKKIIALRWQELWIIGIGTIPAVLVGFLLKDAIESVFASALSAAVAVLFTAGLNFYTHHLLNRKVETSNEIDSVAKISTKKALFIGLLQAAAITPGISRSGSTVWAGVFSKLDRQTAFEYSFLLSIPAILGAVVLQLADGISMAAVPLSAILAGLITAFGFGFFSLRLLQFMIRKANFAIFGWYCLIVGIVGMLILR